VTPEDVASFSETIAAGGVVLFPADTVYGLAADPGSASAVERLHRLKNRDEGKPAAVMFFSLERALAGVPELGPRTRAAMERLLPGPVTLVLPTGTGVRVPRLEGELAPLAEVELPVVQSSANLAGAPDPRRLSDVDASIRAGVDLELDGGELPGTPSTVVDLTGYEADGAFAILREGALPAVAVRQLL
jgi:L-threonylcarbamoyladenylate synthase